MTWQELRAHIDAKIEGIEDRRERWDIVSTVRWVLRIMGDGPIKYISADGARMTLTENPELAVIFDGRDNEELKFNFYHSIAMCGHARAGNCGTLEIALWGAQ